MKFACISIDYDEINDYRKIHDISELKDSLSITRDSSKGIESLIRNAKVPITAFLTGASYRPFFEDFMDKVKDGLAEVANHSYSHDYALTRSDPVYIEAQIRSLHDLIAEYGVIMKGFRSPGWHLNAEIAQVLQAVGYSYTSCFNPSRLYYAMKYIWIKLSKITGKTPASVIHPIDTLRTPTLPYFPDPQKPHICSDLQQTLLEIPISVSLIPPFVPFTGYFIFKLKNPKFILPRHEHPAIFNLHALDFVHENSPSGRFLKSKEGVLQTPLSIRLNVLENIIKNLKNKGYQFVTMETLRNNLNSHSA
ncbi:polysaccharide deacetylase family protein [Myxococcota bacterium]|nr:polysaccharide deacetylase family protein [Myxococcota bacterium]MBU1382438.1 polysaccharide deacetylase family protein [Myxococcota bacterium]MBU1498494.1 polysaccharide deacetylase family protein [Myxococcota bacterium]